MSPIERAARALCVADNHDPEELVRKPEPIQFVRPGIRSTIPQCPRWQTYTFKARAVLEAIREPSAAMISAAWNHRREDDDHSRLGEEPLPEDAWPAMIDAALEEGR